jgi:isoquinoline 1-oxidoreductase beta subunit
MIRIENVHGFGDRDHGFGDRDLHRDRDLPDGELSRRDFLKMSALAGAGLVLSASSYAGEAATPGELPPDFSPNAFLSIDGKGQITIWVARSEMGQGARTAMPMLVADELEADWGSIRIVQALADAKYGDMTTGGSTSVRNGWEPLRKAGAAAREMLLTAAAQSWNVDRSSCRPQSGMVIHDQSGRKLSYGSLVEAASKLPVPTEIPLKDPKDFTLIGRPVPRLDVPEKITGAAVFGLDVRLPGMLYASLARCPVRGGKVKSFDSAAALGVPGVRQVVQVDAGVAVVAESSWAAIQGRGSLTVSWDEGSNAAADGASVRKSCEDALSGTLINARREGDPKAALAGSSRKIDAVYELPFLAHATLEPMNCTADVREGSCEVWAPTQAPQWAQRAAAQGTGVPQESVKVHVTLLGGGFGRRLVWDVPLEAVQISKAIGAPVQVLWTREDDMTGDYYRPCSLHRLSGALDGEGRLSAWLHRLAAPSAVHDLFGAEPDGANTDVVDGAAQVPYSVPNILVECALIAPPVRVGWWRSVYNTQNAFANECFLDEMAALAGRDPFEFRRSLLPEGSRLRGVCELAASKAGWGTPLAPGRGRGIACHTCFGSYVAQVVEVTVDSGRIRVNRAVCAVDCGRYVNPDTVAAQIEGAVIFGLTAALNGEITLEKGRVVQKSFADYPILRMSEVPEIEVHIVPSTEAPGGIGEPGVPPSAPALANAIYAATGRRIRRLPIRLG